MTVLRLLIIYLFSKGTSLFLISQLKMNNETVPICDLEVCKKYETSFESVPTLTWKLCIFTILIFPEVLSMMITTYQSLNIIWRIKEEIYWFSICLEILCQTLHVTGMLLLVFVTLPSLSIVNILIMFNCCLFVPNISRIFMAEERKIVYLVLDILSLVIGVTGLVLMVVYSTDDVDWILPLGLTLASFTWWRCFFPDRVTKEKNTKLFKYNTLTTMISSYWKIFAYSVGFIIVLYVQDELKNNTDTMGFEFDNQVILQYKPPSPPFLPLNDTIDICFPGSTVAYPDQNDCSGFWVRNCTSYLPDVPSLSYVQCPGDKVFVGKQDCPFVNNECCSEDPWISLNCTSYNCTNRDNITNKDNTSYLVFKFPDNKNSFTDWRIDIETTSLGRIYPVLVMLIQIGSTFLAYKSIIIGCKSQIKILQIEIALGLPVILSITLTYAIALFVCDDLSDQCKLSPVIPSGIIFSCGTSKDEFYSLFKIVYILVFVAELWICRHIWVQTTSIMAKSDTMFSSLYYNSILIDQALLIQRRSNEKITNVSGSGTRCRKVKIKACATMWHETGKEMMKLLKSVKGTITKLNTIGGNRHGCIWETHIFFDDAFSNGELNSYVKEFLTAMKDVFQEQTCTIIETPYGGELQWKIQGTTFVCHLKDKVKIKNKKRWSQCMYITFFLKEHLCNLSFRMKKHLDENEYILALDGDIIFNFDAVEKLIDVAKQDPKVGAVCGQIHPVGKGFIPIYQKFEYQLGHWLQKSTESILGNVLCSPGCFSLIRLKALIHPSSYDQKLIVDSESEVDYGYTDDVHNNYAKKLEKSSIERYLTESSESMHYVQYDQGEDRWLCTLLIERGWKIQYSALSHCETACPETFDEFYNQRRRWSPSTVANIWDLLYNGGPTLLKHGHLSILHILYQLLILSASSIGPGSVFLMLVGGTKLAFQMTNWTALIINALIILVYLMVSIFSQRKNHILVAKAISLVYGLFMITILISMIIDFKQQFERCTLTPSILSLSITTGSFLFVAILHLFQRPSMSLKFFFQTDLLKFAFASLVFFITIPCMFLLLPFFCVFNIDDISWGTRESKDDVKIKQKSEKKKSVIYKIQRRSGIICEETPQQINEILRLGTSWIQDLIAFDKKTTMIVKVLDEKESGFWSFVLEGESDHQSNYQEFLKSSLKPTPASKAQMKEISSGLQAMRTEIFLIFLFLNASWSFAIFWMQQAFEDDGTFGLNWTFCPLSEGISGNNSYTSSSADLMPAIKYYQVDPINTVFLILFIFILILQMIGMLVHRIQTMGHWLAGVSIFTNKKNSGMKEASIPEHSPRANYHSSVKYQNSRKNNDHTAQSENKKVKRFPSKAALNQVTYEYVISFKI